MRVDAFDYELPESLIAQRPATPRDSARLMVLRRSRSEPEHRVFSELPDLLSPGDLLVLNETKVLPARLIGTKQESGGRIELLLLRRRSIDTWEVLAKPGRRLRAGARAVFGEGRLVGEVLEELPSGGRLVRFDWQGTWEETLDELGRMPLPPYIKAPLDRPERYQTVYAKNEGSVAAPTAGLHFTGELFARLEARGVGIARLTLHVGLGTFRPVSTDTVEEHEMHEEYFEVPKACAEAVNRARREQRRVVAVGTTVARALETAADEEGRARPGEGWTDIFIYPGYAFRCVDALITNFHLPRSTLLMLVSALAGRERILAAYEEAKRLGYRFYSFGDAMMIEGERMGGGKGNASI